MSETIGFCENCGKKLETNKDWGLILTLIVIGLPLLILATLIIYESNNYDEYQKFKPFCEENNLTIKKNPDLKTQECYKIESNQIIKRYTPKEIDDGVFALEELKKQGDEG